jgi:hypothetical protein
VTLATIAGTGGVAGAFTIGPQNPDSLVKPNGDVVAAMTIQATEANYGVWFKFTVPLTVYNTSPVAGAVGPAPAGAPSAALQVLIFDRAKMIYDIGQLVPVTSIYYLELVNTQTLFSDYLIVTVSTPDFSSSSEALVPLDPTQEAEAVTTIDNTFAQLTANLTLT